ncbi:MAG: alpha/beta fold hydrolase [Candidatus Eisenbacteria bacterium]
MLKGPTLLLFLALLFRVSGSAVRTGRFWLPHPGAGWIAVAAGVWLYAGAAGAWVSPVAALFAGIAAAFADPVIRRPRIRFLFDPAVVVILGLLSLPAFGLSRLGAAALVAAALGYVIDRVVGGVPQKARSAAAVLPAAALVLAVLFRPWLPAAIYDLVEEPMLEGRLARITLASPAEPRREVLDTGAVAWIEKSPGAGTGYGALFFHGANPMGAMQPAAEVLRRALRAAGYTVLSLDAAGFGGSPAPPEGAPLAAWDPEPHALSALARLRAEPGVEKVIVVGHSMGVYEAIRLFDHAPEIAGVILFGGSLGGGGLTDYWYERFHRDRRLSYRLPRESVEEIGRRFSDIHELVEKIRPDHPPVLFVRFENEFDDILSARSALEAAFSGEIEAWDVKDSNHYFNGQRRLDLVSADAGVARAVAAKLREFRIGREAGPADLGSGEKIPGE